MRCKLSEIALVSAGQGAPQGDSNYCESGTPFVKAGNLQELSNGASIDAIQKVSNEVAATHGLKLQRKGSVLFAKSGMSCLKGYVYVLPEDAYIVSHLACVTPMGVDSDYLCYYFRFHRPNKLVKDAAYPSISLADIGCLEIEIPEGNEVTQIVDALKRVESIINLHCQQLTVLDTLIKARFVELFGDTIFNESELPAMQLAEMADIVSGITKGRKTKETDLREVPYMAVSNVKSGYIDWTTVKTIMATPSEIEQYRLQPDDVLMTEGGDPDKVGRGAIIRKPLENCIHQNHIFRVRLNEEVILPVYFAEYLQHSKAKDYFLGCAKQTTGIASINMKQLRALPVLVPPIELQTQFATFVAQIYKSKAVVQKALDEAQTLFDSLMQQYFG